MRNSLVPVWTSGKLQGFALGEDRLQATRLAALFSKAEELARLLREARYHLELEGGPYPFKRLLADIDQALAREPIEQPTDCVEVDMTDHHKYSLQDDVAVQTQIDTLLANAH